MKKIILISFIIFHSAFIIPSLAQTGIGIDCNQPISNSTGEIYPNATAAVVATTCTQWVRLNFILGPWSSPSDQTLHSGKTWKQTYDEIVNGFVQQGIEVYGLISDQAYTSPQGLLEQYPGDASLANAWINQYTANFVQIVDYYKDRVRVFESINEPNNWTYSPTAFVHPAWFAKTLEEIYLNTKYFNGHWGDPAWQVTLTSGGILTHDSDDGASYIDDTYWYGKNTWAWDWISAQTGSYPLDGMGLHFYVAGGSTNVATITTAINQNLNAFWDKITFYEGTGTSKKVWVSEFGWESNAVGYQGQADNLTASFNLLKSDSRIALALWFCLMDWPGVTWGIYEFGNFPPSDQKLSFNAFKNQMNCYATNLQANPDCFGNVNFSWTNSGSAWALDISTDPNFNFYYNKTFSNQTTTNAPSGFVCDVGHAPCTPGTLIFQPNTTYYWRIWNGFIHTIGNSFTIPTPLAAPTITPSGATTFCQGGSVTLDAGTGYSTYLWSNNATSQTINVTSSANYSVTITDGNGCLASSSVITVTVNLLPTTPTITQNGNILSSSATSGNQWYFNGTILNGDTIQNYTLTQIGNYSLTVTDINLCSATSATVNIIATDLKFPFPYVELPDAISIYPNPNNGSFILKYNIAYVPLKITLLNLLGEQIDFYNIPTNNGEFVVNLPLDQSGKVSQGIYFMQVLTEDKIVNKKIIIQ